MSLLFARQPGQPAPCLHDPRPETSGLGMRRRSLLGWRLTGASYELRNPGLAFPRLVQRQERPAAKFVEARDANFDVSLRFETAR